MTLLRLRPLRLGPLPIALACLLACACGSTGEVSVQPPAPPEPHARAEGPYDRALVLLDEGDGPGALAALEALVPLHLADPRLPDLLERAAVRAGDVEGLLDRLDADSGACPCGAPGAAGVPSSLRSDPPAAAPPPPGAAEQGGSAVAGGAERVSEASRADVADRCCGPSEVALHRLRVELALRAGRHADATNAARRVQEVDPEVGAALLAVTWKRTSPNNPPPVDLAGLSPAVPAELLLLAAFRPTAPTLGALETTTFASWQARLLQARLLERGWPERALGLRREVLALADPEASGAAARDLAGASPRDPGAVLELRARALKASLAQGRLELAVEDLGRAVQASLAAGRPSVARALASEVEAALPPDGPGRLLEAARRAEEGRLALALGDAGLVAERLPEALAVAERAAHEGLAHDLAWTLGLAAWLLDDDALLTSAASSGGPDHTPWMALLGAQLLGEALPARLPRAPADRTGVWVHVAASRGAALSGGDTVKPLRAAVRLADKLGEPVSRVQTRLWLEAEARRVGSWEAAAVRQELAGLARGLGPALEAEVLARRVLAGERSSGPGQEAGLWTAGWAALGARRAPPDDAPADPVVHRARARALLVAGDVAGGRNSLRQGLAGHPVALTGPWAALSVLDGLAGVDPAADLVALRKLGSREAALVALELHEHARAQSAVAGAFLEGDDPARALATADRRALWAAVRRWQAVTLGWLVGDGAAPEAERQAVIDALASAAEVPAFRLALGPGPVQGQAWDAGLGVLSVRLGQGAGEVVAVGPRAWAVVPLGSAASLERAARDLVAGLSGQEALRPGAVATALSEARARDLSTRAAATLRGRLLDPVYDALSGSGQWAVLPDGALRGLPFGALPEPRTRDLRVGDARYLTVADSLAHVIAPPVVAPRGVGWLALAPTRLAEVETVGPLFAAGARRVELGDAARGALVGSGAGLLHLAGPASGPRAGLVFADGVLELARVRALDLAGTMVLLTGQGPPERAWRQAQAFHVAGARAVVFAPWTLPEAERATVLAGFVKATQRGRPPARALFEAAKVTPQGTSPVALQVWGAAP